MTPARRYTPQQDAPLSSFCTLLEGNGLAGAVIVQPSFLGSDNSFLLSALAEARERNTELDIWGVVAVPPATPTEDLERLRDCGVIGARMNLLGAPVPDLSAPVWRSFFKVVNQLGWHLELHVEGPRLPAVLPELIKRCDRVVIDHFGLPDPKQPQACRGLRHLLDAPKDALWVKASAPYRVFEGLPTAEAARRCGPLYRILVEALGENRVLWGSDWPWTRFASVERYDLTLSWLEVWRRGRASDG